MLKKEEYIKSVKRPYPPLSVSLIIEGHPNPERFRGMLTEDFCIKNMLGCNGMWYYDKKALEYGGKLVVDSWMNADHFEYTKKEFDIREKKLIEASTGENFAEYCEAYKNYMPALILIYVGDKYVAEALRDKLLKKVSPEEVEHIMFELNVPYQDNFFKKEEYDLVNTDDIEGHVNKYRWILSRYGDLKEYTVEQAVEKKKSINKEEYLLKYKEEKEKVLSAIENAKKILGDDSIIVDIFQYFVYYRTHRTDVMNKSSFLVSDLSRREAESVGLDYDNFLLCTDEEINSRNFPSSEILAQRAEHFSLLLEDGKVRIVSGDESREIEKYLEDSALDVKEIKGQIACKGKIVGVAKIIGGKKDFDKIVSGDIIVASMTTPEMIQLMKIASAFITDEGGVTCHAAIISRELNKPCIIGTKNATKILKDGDLVEVDANTGMVKIIK